MNKDHTDYVRKHRQQFIDATLAGIKQSVGNKVAFFMAGTPGSGKTETAKGLSELYGSDTLAVIDADRFRTMLPGYTADKAFEYQGAANKAVNVVFDKIVNSYYSFILDGTFASSQSKKNIERAIVHNFVVNLVFVYQNPVIAWQFTQKRAATGDRNVPLEVFINSYFSIRENCMDIMHNLDNIVNVMGIKKDYENNTELTTYNKDEIMSFLKVNYTKDSLRREIEDAGNH